MSKPNPLLVFQQAFLDLKEALKQRKSKKITAKAWQAAKKTYEQATRTFKKEMRFKDDRSSKDIE
jgi:Pyruvate/2-oxoacid:ferredoxin oxidoreductase gamma subunit